MRPAEETVSREPEAVVGFAELAVPGGLLETTFEPAAAAELLDEGFETALFVGVTTGVLFAAAAEEDALAGLRPALPGLATGVELLLLLLWLLLLVVVLLALRVLLLLGPVAVAPALLAAAA